MWLLPRRSLSRRLTLSVLVMFALLVATAGLGLNQVRHVSGAIASLKAADLERLWLTSAINEEASDGARKLTVLLAAPPELRPHAHAEIAAAERRLDSDMLMLASLMEGGNQHPHVKLIRDALRRYREAYRVATRLIEEGNQAAARQAIVESVDVALSLLISTTQHLDHTERQRLGQRLAELDDRLDHDRAVLLVLGLLGAGVALCLTVWVLNGVARPLRAVARAARRLGRGDYSERLNDRRLDEVGDIGAAFNQLADAVQQRERALRALIDIDPLTGLLQRDRFIDLQAEPVREAAAGRCRAVLVCYDIERLKAINTLLGFDAGDAAIRHVAQRAMALAGAGQSARVGGGTFATWLPLEGHESPLERARAFRAALDQSIRYNGHVMDLSVTLGYALCPGHGETPADLLRRGEQALYEAKRTRVSIAAYSPSIEAARLDHLSLLGELQQAIERGELVPFLQPKLCLRTNTVVSAEALVRWRHPTRGWVSPAEFIPFAESTGRIVAVTRCMLRQCVDLLADQLPHIQLAVNVSTYDLRDPAFPGTVRALLAERALAPGRLRIEVTESGLLDSGQDPIERLSMLRALGVGVSIDDFGTGQSSLAYLRRLPANELKIDRSFISQVDQDASRCQMLAAIIGMARGLGLSVTAEGAETEGELEQLRRLGCDAVQGYVVGRPMPVAEFLARHLPA